MKKIIVGLGLIILGVMPTYAQQNKVVVIPLGGESVAGSDKQIQFNNNGSFDGAANFYYDSVNNRVGLGTDNPTQDFEIIQSTGTATGSGGLGFKLNVSSLWKIYHSGTHLSFAEVLPISPGVRRAYIEAGTGNYVQPSSRKLKSNINFIDGSLDKVLQLKPVSYNYKNTSPNQRTFGFIAEEVAQILPELVRYDENGEPGIAYAGFGPIAIGAIKQQQLQLDQLKKENQTLRARLDRLEAAR